MTRRVVLRPAAERDLLRLVDFLASLDERAAGRRQVWLQQSLLRIARHPYMGKPGPQPGLRQRTLKFGKSSYLVRYQVTDDVVIVTRIWHGKENRPG